MASCSLKTGMTTAILGEACMARNGFQERAERRLFSFRRFSYHPGRFRVISALQPSDQNEDTENDTQDNAARNLVRMIHKPHQAQGDQQADARNDTFSGHRIRLFFG
jgi:hypothetical protein